jgi:SAM-dependent methyltransferase
MDEFELLVDLHGKSRRQGPGGDAETKRAMELAGLYGSRQFRIADIGCGTGASTLLLAQELNAELTGVDLFPEFLEQLESEAARRGLSDRVSTFAASMDDLPFGERGYDVIWSEGAVYNIGFEKGISYWRQFLKPGGVLAVSEITWLTRERPRELEDFWQTEYPEIATAAAKMDVLERHGFTPRGYFYLPERCWAEEYYEPLKKGFDEFLWRQGNSEKAVEIVENEREEIALYEKYRGYYSYGFYVAVKQEL